MAIETNDIIDIQSLPPFKKFIMTIGNIPTSYLESMTYAELLMWFCDYLQNTVIPTVNNNADAVEELQNLFIELKNYVDNYFNNLDVQEEINNKLDLMAQDGSLTNLIKPYIDPLIEEQNIRIDTIEHKVDTVASGSPIAVSSTSEMTDTNKIYVNVSNGYWYYYSGTEWLQGGVYQSSQNVDAIQGLIDAYNTFNIKGIIDWQVGNISNQTGEVTSGNYLVITPDLLEYDYDIYINFSSYTNTTIYLYNNDETYNKYVDIGQNENKGYFIPAGQKFRLKLNYVTEPSGGRPDIHEDDPKETDLYLNLFLYRYNDYKNIQYNELENSGNSFEYDNLKYYDKLILGDYGSTGLNQNKNNYRRLVPSRVLKYSKDIVITSKAPAQAYIWYYDDVNETNAKGQGWKDIYNTPFVIQANQCFRYVVSESNTYNEPLHNVFTNNVFKNLIVKFYTQTDTPILNPNIKYINSVAHQGYSDTDTYNRSKAGGYTKAKEQGFNYGETDIRFTLDGIPVCCHDASFVSDGITIVIADETLAQLKTYDYYGGTIASLEEIVAECKEVGIGLYIDHLVNSWTDAQWNTIFTIISKYQMQDNVKWLLTTSNVIANKILSWYKYSSLAVVTSDSDLTNVINFANNIKTDFNKVSIDIDYLDFNTTQLNNIVANLNPDIKVEVWTIDNLDTCKAYMPYVSGITSNKYSVIDMIS